MLPVAPEAAEALFRVVDAAYEKRSIALTRIIDPAGFDELMPKTLATATVDRLLHHAHFLLADGNDSHRLAQANAGKGGWRPTPWRPPTCGSAVRDRVRVRLCVRQPGQHVAEDRLAEHRVGVLAVDRGGVGAASR